MSMGLKAMLQGHTFASACVAFIQELCSVDVVPTCSPQTCRNACDIVSCFHVTALHALCTQTASILLIIIGCTLLLAQHYMAHNNKVPVVPSICVPLSLASQRSFVQVELPPALEVATAGPQTPLELAASVAAAAPGHHHLSSSSAPTQDSAGLPLLCICCLTHYKCFMLTFITLQYISSVNIDDS